LFDRGRLDVLLDFELPAFDVELVLRVDSYRLKPFLFVLFPLRLVVQRNELLPDILIVREVSQLRGLDIECLIDLVNTHSCLRSDEAVVVVELFVNRDLY